MLLTFVFILFFGYSTCTETIRVFKQYANTVELKCPLTSNMVVDQIRWLDEKNDYNKPDDSIVVDLSNLLASSQSNIVLYNYFQHVSCGYMSNNKYVRIKSWEINYIDPTIELQITNNPALTQFSKINQTHSSIAIANSFESYNWKEPYDFLRFKCKTNFDYPIHRRIVWLNLYNPATCLGEIWHKEDFDNETPDDQYQLFTNPNTGEKRPVSRFIKLLYVETNYMLHFQCGSYFNSVDLICKSDLVTILNGGFFKPNTTNWNLIGGIIGGVLGFLLLLCLLCLLIFCCLRCRKRNKFKKKTEIGSQNRVTTPITVANISSSLVKNNMNVNMNENVDQSTQFNNNLIVTQAKPDYYLNILEVYPDQSEVEIDINRHNEISESYHHEKIVTQNFRQENYCEYSYQSI